jgi:hypothetical protein
MDLEEDFSVLSAAQQAQLRASLKKLGFSATEARDNKVASSR